MSETFTHVTAYDAGDRHSIEFHDDRIYGCGCGFQCPTWDFEGETLVDHLRELPRRVAYTATLDNQGTLTIEPGSLTIQDTPET